MASSSSTQNLKKVIRLLIALFSMIVCIFYYHAINYITTNTTLHSLIQVDFFWINRDQKSFEWFLKLLGQMEAEQASDEAGNHKFLDIHMYLTAALQRTDMRAVALQTAIEILHKRVLLHSSFLNRVQI